MSNAFSWPLGRPVFYINSPYALAALDLAFGERDAFRHGRLLLAAG
jgi:hypothetical protein